MGTPHFAGPVLKAMSLGGFKPLLVVTQPDRPLGRSRDPQPPPVKRLSEELGIPVFQPDILKTPEARETLAAIEPDLIVVAAFGQILPKTVLDIPRAGCVNVHASVLPRHRGASPIARAIWDGDAETGISIMKMDVGLDTGPVYATEKIPIRPTSTAGDLEEELSQLGASLLVRVLPEILEGKLSPVPQDGSLATPAPKLSKADGLLDFTRGSHLLERQVRATNPWPGSYFIFRGQEIKVHRAAIGSISPIGTRTGCVQEGPGLRVSCGDGYDLMLVEIQRPGKRAMPSEEVMRGFQIPAGSLLTP